MEKGQKFSLILLVFGALSLFVFLPVIFKINSAILGNVKGYAPDGLQNIWNLWWSNKTCLGFYGNLWKTNYLFYPEGVGLLFQTFAFPTLALMLPLTKIGLGFVMTYNLSLILLLFFSMLSMFLLVKYLTKDYFLATFAGIAYGLSPYMLMHILDGQVNMSSIFYFPLIILLTLKLLGKRKYSISFVLGLVLLLVGLTDFTYLIFAFGTITLLLLFNLKEAKEAWKNLLLSLIIFIVPFFIFFFPVVKNYNNFELSNAAQTTSQLASIRISNLLKPPPYSILGKTIFRINPNRGGIASDKGYYFGFLLLFLAVFRLLKKQKEDKFFLLLFVIGFILALGPAIKILGISVPLPFLLLEKFPVLNALRVPTRFLLLSEIAIIVLASLGLQDFLKNNKSKKVPILVFLILFFEFLPLSMPISNLNKPTVYDYLSKQKGDFAVLEIPFYYASGLKLDGYYTSYLDMYYQTFHNKKIASGYVTRTEKNKASEINDKLVQFVLYEQSKVFKDNTKIVSKVFSTDINNNISNYQKSVETPLENNQFRYIVFKKPNESNFIENLIDKNIKEKLTGHLLFVQEDPEYQLYQVTQ